MKFIDCSLSKVEVFPEPVEGNGDWLRQAQPPEKKKYPELVEGEQIAKELLSGKAYLFSLK